MSVVALALIIGLLPAFIAQSKGRSFFGWWIYGALVWIVAFPHSLLLKRDTKALDQQAVRDGMKKCPACAEMIRARRGFVATAGPSSPSERQVDLYSTTL